MTSLDAHILPRPLPARVAAGFSRTWRALVGAIRLPEGAFRTFPREAGDRDALAGLGEHMLKDVGASSWLVASAATRARDELRRCLDAGV